ncbi:thioredoxin family protein [Sphingomonas sp.]|uniref:thioredoxin family protein n=1 Tax=Sphingomonas sp. TaxID=28214 RepID=UPI0017FAD89E|nr:thioredoxin family protein [Sphingomonas sp.]MBA3511115.1 thioredoxin family protein [Sphingomonas sp.]
MRFGSVITAAIAGLVVLSAPAAAAEVRKFDQTSFAQAQRQGRPILVDVTAEWCTVCKAQGKQISAITRNPAFNKLLILRLDYDRQKAQRRRLNVPRQSTLIAYRGQKETGRLVAVSERKAIESLLRSAVR